VVTAPAPSRWAPLPAHATEAEAPPAGFAWAGVAAGLKPSGNPDVGLVVGDPGTVSAARFTRSGTAAPPVLVTQDRADCAHLRAVVVNSGNANAATGVRGAEDAIVMQEAAAARLGLEPRAVAVCSTGVIGVPLPMDRVRAGIADAAGALGGDPAPFQAAISTTDLFDKRASVAVRLEGGTVRLAAQCKGAGMIQPAFATMLCFVQTDAALDPETADLLLGVCVKRSFDRISVDGQLSTNDAAILQASGASGVRVAPESEDERALGEALDAALRRLALLIVRDGEGARRAGRVLVRGGHPGGVEAAARAVANSPLVKTALHGGDPNWGRIAQAVGMALPGTAPLALDIAIEGVQVCSAGAFVPHDAADLAARVQRDEVEIAVGLPGDGHETEVFFSDLGHEYIRINAEYTT
jgi:glutamate N-acetyltransferase / amino-acid N-acetyltransferase